MGASSSFVNPGTDKVAPKPVDPSSLDTSTWSFGELSLESHCYCEASNCEMRRKLKEICLTEDGQCVRCAAGMSASTCDDTLGSTLDNCVTQQPTQATDSWFDSVPDWTRQAESVSIGDTLDSKCLEVESFSMNRNLVEHGLPLMLRVGEVGNRFSEYFVCVHKGGDNFSLLDRRISREKHNFHYAWEDVSIYHYVQPVLPETPTQAGDSSPEVAAERPAQALKSYYTDEVVRCTFHAKCNPRQIDLMFKTKQALQCWVHLLQSKLLVKISQVVHPSLSPCGVEATLPTPSTSSLPLPLPHAHWVPMDLDSPQAETVWEPSPSPTTATSPENDAEGGDPQDPVSEDADEARQEKETETSRASSARQSVARSGSLHSSERPPDWATMSERSLNSFYAV
mmetsp:Transcript_134196/g.189605  ORF Transcript_134196/g.189605 Transcript_134196/m.189605 type:complete len:397 (-) Transcript_134196:74-1264(-)